MVSRDKIRARFVTFRYTRGTRAAIETGKRGGRWVKGKGKVHAAVSRRCHRRSRSRAE
jgi:hypothetical protein